MAADQSPTAPAPTAVHDGQRFVGRSVVVVTGVGLPVDDGPTPSNTQRDLQELPIKSST